MVYNEADLQSSYLYNRTLVRSAVSNEHCRVGKLFIESRDKKELLITMHSHRVSSRPTIAWISILICRPDVRYVVLIVFFYHCCATAACGYPNNRHCSRTKCTSCWSNRGHRPTCSQRALEGPSVYSSGRIRASFPSRLPARGRRYIQTCAQNCGF